MGKYNRFIISGPCVIEDEYTVMKIAEKVKELTSKYNFHYIFKASFDKANRTSINSFRGPGIGGPAGGGGPAPAPAPQPGGPGGPVGMPAPQPR